MTALDVPARLAARPVFHGLVVPFTVAWFDGVPDFRVTDTARVARCISERRCGACGKVIRGECAFIGGARSLDSRTFGDPAMHPACARYSAAVCPFVSGRLTEMREPRAGVAVDPHVAPSRTRMGLLFTDGWGRRVVDGRVYILANAGRVEWLDADA